MMHMKLLDDAIHGLPGNFSIRVAIHRIPMRFTGFIGII
jgi:hypothetical protein